MGTTSSSSPRLLRWWRCFLTPDATTAVGVSIALPPPPPAADGDREDMMGEVTNTHRVFTFPVEVQATPATAETSCDAFGAFGRTDTASDAFTTAAPGVDQAVTAAVDVCHTPMATEPVLFADGEALLAKQLPSRRQSAFAYAAEPSSHHGNRRTSSGTSASATTHQQQHAYQQQQGVAPTATSHLLHGGPETTLSEEATAAGLQGARGLHPQQQQQQQGGGEYSYQDPMAPIPSCDFECQATPVETAELETQIDTDAGSELGVKKKFMAHFTQTFIPTAAKGVDAGKRYSDFSQHHAPPPVVFADAPTQHDVTYADARIQCESQSGARQKGTQTTAKQFSDQAVDAVPTPRASVDIALSPRPCDLLPPLLTFVRGQSLHLTLPEGVGSQCVLLTDPPAPPTVASTAVGDDAHEWETFAVCTQTGMEKITRDEEYCPHCGHCSPPSNNASSPTSSSPLIPSPVSGGGRMAVVDAFVMTEPVTFADESFVHHASASSPNIPTSDLALAAMRGTQHSSMSYTMGSTRGSHLGLTNPRMEREDVVPIREMYPAVEGGGSYNPSGSVSMVDPLSPVTLHEVELALPPPRSTALTLEEEVEAEGSHRVMIGSRNVTPAEIISAMSTPEAKPLRKTAVINRSDTEPRKKNVNKKTKRRAQSVSLDYSTAGGGAEGVSPSSSLPALSAGKREGRLNPQPACDPTAIHGGWAVKARTESRFSADCFLTHGGAPGEKAKPTDALQPSLHAGASRIKLNNSAFSDASIHEAMGRTLGGGVPPVVRRLPMTKKHAPKHQQVRTPPPKSSTGHSDDDSPAETDDHSYQASAHVTEAHELQLMALRRKRMGGAGPAPLPRTLAPLGVEAITPLYQHQLPQPEEEL